MKAGRPLEALIVTVRASKVILAADLAAIYGVETKRLNQQVRRNADRFPDDFCFLLTAAEKAELELSGQITSDGRAALRSQIATLKRGRHSKYPTMAFTEHGAIMAATVLNSAEAVAMSVYVVRAFVQMREQITANAAVLKRLAEIDRTLLEHDEGLAMIWSKLEPLLAPPPEPKRRQIGFRPEGESDFEQKSTKITKGKGRG